MKVYYDNKRIEYNLYELAKMSNNCKDTSILPYCNIQFVNINKRKLTQEELKLICFEAEEASNDTNS